MRLAQPLKKGSLPEVVQLLSMSSLQSQPLSWKGMKRPDAISFFVPWKNLCAKLLTMPVTKDLL